MINILQNNDELTEHIFCYKVTLINEEKLLLTSNKTKIMCNEFVYDTYSNLQVVKACFKNTAENFIELYGIYSQDGINYDTQVTDAIVDISLSLIQKNDCNESENYCYEKYELFPLGKYICTKVRKNSLEFFMYLEPIIAQFDKMINPVYSNTCRAKLGDEKCKINLGNFETKYEVSNITENVAVLKSCKKSSGYYDYGTARIRINNTEFKARIKQHSMNTLNLDKIIPVHFRCASEILVTRGCDKTIETCCNVFNNVINFRGEPFIPKKEILTTL